MKRNFLLLLFSGITLLSCNSKSDFYYLHGAIKEKDVQTLYLISSNQSLIPHRSMRKEPFRCTVSLKSLSWPI